MHMKAKHKIEVELSVEDVMILIRGGFEQAFPDMKGKRTSIQFIYGPDPNEDEHMPGPGVPRQVITGARILHESEQTPEPDAVARALLS